MPFRSRPVRLHRLLLLPLAAAPLLLLLPLGALKWRADQRKEWLAEHPPLSQTDKYLQNVLRNADAVAIYGRGKLWKQISGAEQSTLHLEDKAIFRSIATTLRCSETTKPSLQARIFAVPNPESVILGVAGHVAPRRSYGVTLFFYWRDAQGSYLVSSVAGGKPILVQPRFAPRFEALLARLVRQDKARAHRPSASTKAL